MGKTGLVDCIKMSIGNVEFVLDAVVKEMKKIDHSHGKAKLSCLGDL